MIGFSVVSNSRKSTSPKTLGSVGQTRVLINAEDAAFEVSA